MARQMTGGVQNPAFILAGFQIHEIEAHVYGRNEASVQVLAGVAILKSLGMIPLSQARASHRGAAYQDGQGTTLSPRAHRFPCNPTIGGRSLPEFAHARSPMLAEALKYPLAVTDLLPLIANYADGLFEANGACAAVVDAIQKVLDNQAAGQPVNVQLVRDVLTQGLLPGFLRAYEDALSIAQQKDNPNVPSFSILDPGFVNLLNARSISMPDTPNRPKTNIEGVADILLLEKNMANGSVPSSAAPAAIQTYVAQLAAMVPAQP
jgi:hypothetical protein